MSGRIKSLLSDSVIYGLSGIITRFISIFLVPLYTRVFLPEDYGRMGLLLNGISFISILVVLALDNATARWFYDTNDEKDKATSINTWLWCYLALSCVAALLIMLFGHFINRHLLENYSEGFICILIVAGSLPFSAIIAVANNVLRFERKAVPTVLLSLASTLIAIGLNIVFVLWLRIGIKGVFLSTIISNIISSIAAIWLIRKWVRKPLPYDFDRLKKMIRYGWPFIPAGLAYWVVNLSGIFFINGFKDKADVGLYQIGVSLASVLGLVTNAFQQAWAPFAFSIIDQPDAKITYSKVFDVYIILMSTGCVGIALFGKEILMLLTQPQYYGAYDVATILAYSYLFIGLVNIADLGLAITKNTRPLGLVMTISAGLIVIFNLTFIPLWGRVGAALALCLAQAISPIYMFYRSQKAYYIPYNFPRGAMILIFSILISIFSVSVLDRLDLMQGIMLKGGLFIILLLFITIVFKKTVLALVKRRKTQTV